MGEYTATQWLLLFFCYCFLGWVWESCYVSVCQKRWVNRGFLHGPLLPIYGSGAIVILFLTLPVRHSPVLIYLLGMIGATVLEYVTGAVMERLFHVRYWDYSKHRFNLNGHICLSSSLAWGFFSLALVHWLHPPIERAVLWLPAFAAGPLAAALLVAFAVDTVQSVRDALDFRELLTELTESSETLAKIQERLEQAGEDFARRSEVFRARLEELEQQLREKQELREAERRARSVQVRRTLEQALAERRQNRSGQIYRMNQKLEVLIQEARATEPGSELMRDLSQFRERIRQMELTMASHRDRDFRRAVRLLRRNPTATSQRHESVVDALRRLYEERTEK